MVIVRLGLVHRKWLQVYLISQQMIETNMYFCVFLCECLLMVTVVSSGNWWILLGFHLLLFPVLPTRPHQRQRRGRKQSDRVRLDTNTTETIRMFNLSQRISGLSLCGVNMISPCAGGLQFCLTVLETCFKHAWGCMVHAPYAFVLCAVDISRTKMVHCIYIYAC